METGPYAMIENDTNLVINTIVADASFALAGCYFVEITSGAFCQSGMFYDASSGKFLMMRITQLSIALHSNVTAPFMGA